MSDPAPSQTIAPTDEQTASHGVLAAAIRIVSGFTLLSRFAGLARDFLTLRIFGDSALGSAFRAAYALPNFFRRLFGEGALSAAFLPEYAILRRDDPAKAAALASLTVHMLTLVTGSITLLIELILAARLLAPSFIPGISPPDLETGLSIKLIMLMLPMMPGVCLTAILSGMLQGHGKFGPPAAAPILLNLFQIVAALLFYFKWITNPTTAAYIVGAAAVLATVATVVWSLIALRGLISWTRSYTIARENANLVLKRFIPAVIGLGTLQLNTMLDTVVAMWPIWVKVPLFGHEMPLDVKSNSILSGAQTLYQFPLGVFGIAVATAIFPLLSRTADKPTEFIGFLRRGIRLSLFIGLPASAGLIAVRHELVQVIFGGGGKYSFSADGVERAAAVLLGFAPAVWAYSLNHVLTRAFYARGDTITPMRLAMSAVVLNLILNFTLIWPLREAGLAWATATSAIVQCLVLLWLLRRAIRTAPIDGPTLIGLLKVTAVTGLMFVATWITLHFMPAATTWKVWLARLVMGVTVGGVSYAAFALLLRLPEIRWMMQRGPSGKDAASAMSFD